MSDLPSRPIYLDAHATTPVDPRVMEKMLPYFCEVYGNAASTSHAYGSEANAAVEEGRAILAKALKAKPSEIVFTSGATEAINLAIKGVAEAYGDKRRHFITVATEHKAVLDCFEWLQRSGYDVTILPVDQYGMLDPQQVAGAIRPDTALVSVMAANNEIGALQPIEEIGPICRERGVFFMTDATQALGKETIDVKKMCIDLLACSAHKIYGPKGVGALYVRRSNPRVKLGCQIHGGGHEAGMRSGTLNVPGIVGFGEAIRIATSGMKAQQDRIRKLRDQLQKGLFRIAGAKVNGHLEKRLAGNLNICFPGARSEALLIALKGEVALSSGSACTSAAVLPSHVLLALGLSEAAVASSIRFGVGRETTNQDIAKTVDACHQAVARLTGFV